MSSGVPGFRRGRSADRADGRTGSDDGYTPDQTGQDQRTSQTRQDHTGQDRRTSQTFARQELGDQTGPGRTLRTVLVTEAGRTVREDSGLGQRGAHPDLTWPAGMGQGRKGHDGTGLVGTVEDGSRVPNGT